MRETNLLIVGAGPYGLALAAQAANSGVEHIVVGKPMEFWRGNMPRGMYLRSACDWHLDPLNEHTIEAFLKPQRKVASDVEPLSLDFYLSYAEWFQQQKKIHPLPVYIRQLDREGRKGFVAITERGQAIRAKNLVLAPGFRHFKHLPDDLKKRLPPGRFQHTAEFVDFTTAANRRYLIIGGRQSAFEWAALLLEAGAASVHLVHRHPSPAFAVADWSWVNPLVDGMVKNPNWFRNLSDPEKEEIVQRMWGEGRLKVEPWLEPRLRDERVTMWPETEVINFLQESNGGLLAILSNGDRVGCDQVVLATGYKVDIGKLPYLTSGNILASLETRNGFPVLDDHFETSIPGLFITSLPATQDFGPFFAFTISVRVSAKLIGERIVKRKS